MIDFLNPNYYDVDAIPADVPNRPLLIELYERMNEQNERLWEFFTEMTEDPDHKRMTAEAIKPRTLRTSYRKKKAKVLNEMARRKELLEESDDIGYKQFLKDEGFDDLLSPEDRDFTDGKTNGLKRVAGRKNRTSWGKLGDY